MFQILDKCCLTGELSPGEGGGVSHYVGIRVCAMVLRFIFIISGISMWVIAQTNAPQKRRVAKSHFSMYMDDQNHKVCVGHTRSI